MRISKIKTKVGELCTPVSTELSAVVERMRSGNNKEAAERIATSARLSRLMEEEGSPHYYLTDKDRLPYLIFSATFGKDGLDHPKDFTNLLLLDVNCEKGLSQVAMMRRRVAQALNLNRDYGNSMVPLLIGGQGIKKSNFCKNILPPSMREYYMDDIKMENAEQVERVLGRMWLVCIDEYNAKTEREQAKIKRLLTEKDVQARKMRSDQYTMIPRLCSFIATTNDSTPLPSGDGSRRYLCVEVTGEIDMTAPIPYKQMYAQAMTELRQKGCVYWFTSEDEQEIQEHNMPYQQLSSPELILQSLFEPTDQHSKKYFWTVTDIQKEISKHLKASDVPNLKSLGTAIKRLNFPKGGISGIRGYYLTLRK